jgi:hypothetical protein
MSRTLLARPQRRILVVLTAVAMAVGLAGLVPPPVHAATGSGSGLPETHPFLPGDDAMAGEAAHSRAHSPSRIPAAHVPTPATLPVVGDPAALSTAGVTLKDQRDADNGNAFSDEPPDQALCASPTQVIEGVNEIFAIYDHSGVKKSGNETYDMFYNGAGHRPLAGRRPGPHLRPVHERPQVLLGPGHTTLLHGHARARAGRCDR